MHHDLPRDADFWSSLFSIDKKLAAIVRQLGCPCGGRLHCANYPRNPRGGPDDLPREYRYRLSFCCDREGCRKRITPPSVRFFGRKVYLAAVVVLVAALRQGSTPRPVRELSKRFEVDRRTIVRWQGFWREHFPQTPFWRVHRARLVPVPEAVTLPRALLDAFLSVNDLWNSWRRLLEFLSPITIARGLEIEIFR